MTRQIISYPKSGRTWIRYILHLLELSELIQFHHDGFEFNDGSRPPHNFDLKGRVKHYATIDKIIYIRRDPRDLIVSLYFQVTGRFQDFFQFSGTISDFIRDEYFGAQVLAKFRSMWEQIAESPRVLTLDYESCHQDINATMNRLLHHFELDVPVEKIRQATDAASFANMKKLEDENAFPYPWLRRRNDAPKVRKGEVKSYLQSLTPVDIEYLDKIFGL